MVTLKKRYELIKSDKVLFSIFFIYVLLAFFHFAYSFATSQDRTQSYLRCSFCLGIAVTTFFFLRRGFSVSILVYSIALLYFNTFYNYTSFLFVLLAIYCNQKIEKAAVLLYLLNVFVALAIKKCSILAFGIHILNCVFFYLAAKYLFAAITPETLLLTDEEKHVLEEIAKGKLQKEINKFSQNTITKLIKSAMSRNMCKSKAELMQKYLKEYPERIEIESQEICD
ncbi:MAG: hypothetical protein J6S85_01655 [Methanobrevibacter sp.]|nr:hypothetical protein [Methanobrevibacter sp.]MBO7712240.1 hypothetical protein [Methanobrevibacter sp.]